MTKIPVWKTIAECYRLASTRYLSLLGILWLPLLVYLVATHFMTRYAADQLLMAHPMDGVGGRSFGHARSIGYLIQLVGLAFFSVASVALANEACGNTARRRLAYLRFGTKEFYALASFILLMLFVFGIVLVTGIAGGAIIAAIALSFFHGTAISTGAAPGMLELMATLIIAGLTIAAIPVVFIGVRLGFFVAPVAAIENRFGLLRSWELTRGNFWRCLVIFVATAVPATLMAIVLFGITYAAYGRDLIYALSHVATAPRLLEGLRAPMLRTAIVYAPYFWPINVLLAPLTIGILLLAGPVAYRECRPDGYSSDALPATAAVNTGTDRS